MIPFLYGTDYGGSSGFIFLPVFAGSDVSFTDSESVYNSSFSNYTNTSISLPSSYTGKEYVIYGSSGSVRYKDKTISPSVILPIDNITFDSSNFLLFQNGKCVSEAFCSEQYYYVEDDYTEGNVVIEGLGNFFNMIKNLFGEQIDLVENIIESLKNLPNTILEGIKGLLVPDTAIMEEIFVEFIEYLESSFGMNELIDTLKGLLETSDDGSSVGAADVSEPLTYNFSIPVLSKGSEEVSEFTSYSLPLTISIPFSNIYTNSIKETVGGYMRGIFFILLIFYNLSEIYFLIRGTRPWKDPAIVSELNLIQEEKAQRHARRRGR